MQELHLLERRLENYNDTIFEISTTNSSDSHGWIGFYCHCHLIRANCAIDGQFPEGSVQC